MSAKAARLSVSGRFYAPWSRIVTTVNTNCDEFLCDIKIRLAAEPRIKGRVTQRRFYIYYMPRLRTDGYYNSWFAVYSGRITSTDEGCAVHLTIRPNLLGCCVCALPWLLLATVVALNVLVISPPFPLIALLIMMGGGVLPMYLFQCLAFWWFEKIEEARMLQFLFPGNF